MLDDSRTGKVDFQTQIIFYIFKNLTPSQKYTDKLGGDFFSSKILFLFSFVSMFVFMFVALQFVAWCYYLCHIPHNITL